MKRFLIIFLILLFVLGGFFYWKSLLFLEKKVMAPTSKPQKTKEKLQEELTEPSQPGEISMAIQRIVSSAKKFIDEKKKFLETEKARKRSENVKGLYMNEFVANSKSIGATKIREDIKKLLFETELNAIVIDVKEAYGPNLPSSLKKLIGEFKEKNFWVIARICVFRDSSLVNKKPELYLKSKSGDFWKDYKGNYWLDPQSSEVKHYLIEFSKKVIDFGFDELQFDYIRFPSDGNLEDIVYPAYDGKKEKREVIREFFSNLSKELKSYKSEIILSVDLFGLVAIQYVEPGVGQSLEDAAEFFDYISPMLYPSHFYGGFEAKEDFERGLPALYFPYEAEDISQVVSNHPYEVIFRSILSASDYLLELGLDAQIRPWLQDFSLRVDTERGIYYDAEKVKAQIRAAEDAGASGWLLWNPANIYTEAALKK